jgi:lysine-specific demethylase 8
MAPEKVLFWHGIGTVSLSHTDDKENFMCVIKGWKQFTIVSPFESHKVYMGQSMDSDQVPANYSPVNFDEIDYELFPDMHDVTVHKVMIEEGDCLFLPAWWWHRVTSSPDETIAVSHSLQVRF